MSTECVPLSISTPPPLSSGFEFQRLDMSTREVNAFSNSDDVAEDPRGDDALRADHVRRRSGTSTPSSAGRRRAPPRRPSPARSPSRCRAASRTARARRARANRIAISRVRGRRRADDDGVDRSAVRERLVRTSKLGQLRRSRQGVRGLGADVGDGDEPGVRLSVERLHVGLGDRARADQTEADRLRHALIVRPARPRRGSTRRCSRRARSCSARSTAARGCSRAPRRCRGSERGGSRPPPAGRA